MDETRARFLAAIAAQLPVERIAEVHLFAAIRQGGVESGVAVIALEQEQEAAPQNHVATPDAEPTGAEVSDENEESLDDVSVAAPPMARRYVVCTARYRHTLKGPNRGKWEVTVTEEADAPLLTVDAVVRGVQRRSGDLDEIVRLTGDEVRGSLPAPAAP
jgi:hypothetical protein